jgi:hypothetical protein
MVGHLIVDLVDALPWYMALGALAFCLGPANSNPSALHCAQSCSRGEEQMKHIFEVTVCHNGTRDNGTVLLGVADNTTDAIKRAIAWAKRHKDEFSGPHTVTQVKWLGEKDF